ncbi:hypothetical protein IWX50DRAFT_638420 [Phyllosticta citricarpa]
MDRSNLTDVPAPWNPTQTPGAPGHNSLPSPAFFPATTTKTTRWMTTPRAQSRQHQYHPVLPSVGSPSPLRLFHLERASDRATVVPGRRSCLRWCDADGSLLDLIRQRCLLLFLLLPVVAFHLSIFCALTSLLPHLLVAPCLSCPILPCPALMRKHPSTGRHATWWLCIHGTQTPLLHLSYFQPNPFFSSFFCLTLRSICAFKSLSSVFPTRSPRIPPPCILNFPTSSYYYSFLSKTHRPRDANTKSRPYFGFRTRTRRAVDSKKKSCRRF